MGGLAIRLIYRQLLPAILVILLAIAASAIFGGIWGAIPGYSGKARLHIVITTIMFNFIAASIMVWLLAGPLIAPGQMSPETSKFADGVALAKIHVLAGMMGFDGALSEPVIVIALLCCGRMADLALTLGLCHPRHRLF